MPLINYTTKVSVETSLGEIQAILIRHKAKSLTVEFDDGSATGITFVADTSYGPQAVRLPANVEAVWQLLQKEREQGRVAPRFVNREQAARIAWRTVKDWLRAQMEIIDYGMVRFDEIMLPYLVTDSGKTMYQYFLESRPQLAAPSKT